MTNIETLKSRVHTLSNQLQGIMGYLELERYGMALTCARDAISTLRELSKMLTGMGAKPEPLLVHKDSVVVVPPGTKVVTPENVKAEVKKELKDDEVTVISISDVKKGKPN
jgi:hypothetical protein